MGLQSKGAEYKASPFQADSPIFLAKTAWAAAIVVAIGAALTYIWISGWPAGTHADETKKAAFIISGEQDFYHPILSLQIARLVNHYIGYEAPENALFLGRTISGIFGGILILATFILGRRVLSPVTSVAAAAVVAVTPLVAIHSTFLKEDIYMAGPAILGLAGLLVLVDRPSLKLAAAVGLAFGTAISGKFIAALFLAYAIAVVLTVSQDRFASRLRNVAMISAVAAVSFLSINATALLDYDTVLAGLNREVAHATDGHFVHMPIWLTGGIMHLRDSLLPGMGVPLVILGLAGLSTPLLCRTNRKPLAIISGAAILWYAAHEISPLKPHPNFDRYMVPEGPILVVLGAALVEAVSRRLTTRFAAVTASAVMLLSAVPPAYSSYRIVESSAHDPRRVISYVFPYLSAQTHIDRYVVFGRRPKSAKFDESQPLDYLVTSSFWYGRLARYGSHPTQSSNIQDAHEFYYHHAFQKPYLEVASGGPSYAFLNPVVRIVTFNNDFEALLAMGDAILQADPAIRITVGP